MRRPHKGLHTDLTFADMQIDPKQKAEKPRYEAVAQTSGLGRGLSSGEARTIC
jgi:hypothetical protein